MGQLSHGGDWPLARHGADSPRPIETRRQFSGIPDNAGMRIFPCRHLPALLFLLLLTAPAQAWNAAGHRLSAVIAWEQLSPGSRAIVSEALAEHIDYPRWLEKAGDDAPELIFAEAATWPDDIRNDPRFYAEGRDPPTPPLPGLHDTARHRAWHYVDRDRAGHRQEGELDHQLDRLAGQLRGNREKAEIGNWLPWLIHLVADAHQPLHVGRSGDEGGNRIEIENPFNPRLPQTRLHTYWDDLPGPPWLRGKRLRQQAARLLDSYPAPAPGRISTWLSESHALLDSVYALPAGDPSPIIDMAYQQRARDIAGERIVAAGMRLGRLLEQLLHPDVSRETR